MFIKKIIINNKNDIYINLALYINKLMFDENKITYNIYRITQETLLKKSQV